MKAKVLVLGVSSQTWFRGTRDERAVPCLNCMDAETLDGKAIKQTFDYFPSEDENKEIDLTKLNMQPLVLAVEDIRPGNGRLTFRGSIDRSSLPKGALVPAKTPEPGKGS